MMRCGRACRGHLFRESLVVLCVRVNLRLFACSSNVTTTDAFFVAISSNAGYIEHHHSLGSLYLSFSLGKNPVDVL